MRQRDTALTGEAFFHDRLARSSHYQRWVRSATDLPRLIDTRRMGTHGPAKALDPL